MDNVTHSLIGIVLAHLFVREPRIRTAAMWTGVLASNFPDIDLVLRPFFADAKLGYLVHHRGHTHTLLLALLQAPLAVWGGLFLGRVKWSGLEPPLKWALGLLALVSVFVHIGADSWNNYGVHPFWPFDSRWYYGDAIFIVEPLIWMALIPYVVANAQRIGVKALWTGLALAMIALAWRFPGIPEGVAGTVTLWAIFWAVVQHRLRSPLLAFASLVGVLSVFFVGSSLAHFRIEARFVSQTPTERLQEIALTPQPANPLCWQFVVHSRTPGGDLVLRMGLLSLKPEWVAPERCAMRLSDERSAPLTPVEGLDAQDFQWIGKFQAPIAPLKASIAADCRTEAALHFIRLPFWIEKPEGLWLGDLRYDNEASAGFAEVLIPPGPHTLHCDAYRPAWVPEGVKDLLKP